MTYIDKSGRRVTTESAYLTNDVLNRKNLTVAVRGGVTKVLFSNEHPEQKDATSLDTSDSIPRAIGVEFAKEDKKEEIFVVKAAKEVILWYVIRLLNVTHNHVSLSHQCWCHTHSSNSFTLRYRSIQRTISVFTPNSVSERFRRCRQTFTGSSRRTFAV